MVNVPPIPPLLCSTPPPIDFGDEDEDIDALPPTLDGMPDEDYGDYLVTDDSKSIESLPSPRPPSVTDSPNMSFYECPIPTDELFTKHDKVMKSEITESDIQAATTNGNSCKPSTPIIEAFNFSITKQENKKAEDISEESKPNLLNAKQTTCFEDKKNLENNSETQEAIETVTIVNKNNEPEAKIQAISMETNVATHTNIVSIEDLEDDLSEDELYSPKTPKNFTETQDMNSFFAIHEIKNSSNSIKEGDKTPEDSKGNCSEKEVCSRQNSYPANSYDLPPPLDDKNINAAADDEDDFGDFADFQDFSKAYSSSQATQQNINLVPVNDSKINDAKLKLEQSFNLADNSKSDRISPEFINDLQRQMSADNKGSDLYKESSDSIKSEQDNLENSQGVDNKAINSKHNESQDILNDSFGDFNQASVALQEDICERKKNIKTQMTKDAESDDDFGDFADFEQHEVTPPRIQSPEVIKQIDDDTKLRDNLEGDKNDDDDDDDDDDFGDFNTAEPLSQTQTSQPVLKQSNCSSISLQNPLNLTERISKILQFMFAPLESPASTPTESGNQPITAKLQEIPFTSIDAAKALEYQWLNSETRHSFIKSLGIDSRNILYGENWNPSLPRFAANLSFNPLKPMKPVTSNSSGADASISSSCPIVENVSVNSKSDFYQQLTNTLGTKGDGNIELNWKSNQVLAAEEAVEQNTEAFTDNTLVTDVQTPTTTATLANSVPYLATEPTDITTVFENPLDNEEQYSKTPPISEMESVNSFALPTSTAALDMDLSATTTTTQIDTDYARNIELNDLDEPPEDTLGVVVASTTFAGSFKETHIYTPPKSIENSSSSTSSTSNTSPSKATSIDFDYEKAAMGVIIDEMVVKKEYRDIEYNSPFSADSLTKPVTTANVYAVTNLQQTNSPKKVLSPGVEDEFNDEFSDFQSVTTETTNTAVKVSPKSSLSRSSNPSPVVMTNVSACGMILSPAILIPQAISMETQKPKIEWGDSTTSINPEELARIEELFPEPKSVKSNNSNSSQKSTPTHQSNPIMVTTPSISAAIANKELEGTNDDDDWSDFVSVPVTNNNKIMTNNNLTLTRTPSNSPFKQRSAGNPHIVAQQQQQQQHQQQQHYSNSNNDDEWSDFVSSVPTTSAANVTSNQALCYRSMPQFNSGAWQNANFYNNPLSLYHKGPLNLNSAANPPNAPKGYMQNNNNNYTQYNQFQMSGPQQIHVMQNFSTIPVPISSASAVKNNQFQVGSAKVAPSIALIPDLGFVAPAVPTHTSFINSLPKPNINTKK